MGAVAQDRDRVGQLEDLVETVRDIQERHALRLQAEDDIEQRLGLHPVEGGGGLIQNQQAAVVDQRLADLHDLLLANLQAPHGLPGRQVPGLQPLQNPRRFRFHRAEIEQPQGGPDLTAQQHVVGNTAIRQQVEQLVDGRHATLEGISGGLRIVGLPVQCDVPRVAAHGSGEDLHQRALARAVLAQQRQDFAAADPQIHLVQRANARELLADLACFEQR